MTGDHRIELTDSEVIVLDALLDRLTNRPDFEQLVADEADRQALHNLVCVLERADPGAFSNDYVDRVAAARRDLLGGS